MAQASRSFSTPLSSTRHLPQLHNTFATPDGFTLVYNWVDGEGLRPERELGPDEVHPLDRFCALPAAEIIDALNVIYDVHILIEKHGFIAEDFYDGCIIYDFEEKRIHLYDFDHYHPAPFVNDLGRLYGSTRFMAPEEFQKGARIDERTNVFMLGRTAFVLLANNSDSRDDWKGNDAMWHVAKKATQPDKQLRYPSVKRSFRHGTPRVLIFNVGSPVRKASVLTKPKPATPAQATRIRRASKF